MTDRTRAELAAALAITIHSLVVAAGFARVFDGWDFFLDLALLALIGHGWSFTARRIGLPAWSELAMTVIGLTWIVALQRYSATMGLGIPTGRTWERLVLELEVVSDQFPTAVAPVPFNEGWALLASVGVVLVVILADTFAFRAGARAEALVPGTVLFVFISAISSDRLRWEATVALIASGAVAVGAIRSMHARGRATRLHGSAPALSLTGPALLGSALVVATIAGIVGPRLPGADAPPLYETRGRSGVTTIVSPLVDIRSRLTARGDEELFRVDADAPAYWRVSTLASFDGRRFTLPRRPLERVQETGAPAGDGPQNRQQIQIVGLGGLLVPAAADPIGAEGDRADTRLELRVDRDSSALLAPDDLRVGDVFRIVSARPDVTLDSVRSATASAAPDVIFTELPADLPPIVGRLAAQVTAGATTPYERALALQTWFRDPDEFEYSLEVQSGHGSTAIELFLDRRVGYCEQFAATFATMARTLGLPSRVAVGFTPGTLGDDGWYRVLGRNAHAWPELWFDGLGWVAFEPTPGRGLPGAESYTGVAAAQDAAEPDDAPPTTLAAPADPAINPGSGSVPPSTTAVGATASPVPTTSPTAAPDPSGGSLIPDSEEPGSTSSTRTRRVTVVVLIGAAIVASALAARSIVRQRLRRRPPDRRILTAWTRACAAATDAGVERRASMTSQEWATATAAVLPIAARPMASLASVVDVLRYAPDGTVDLDRVGAYGVPLVRECEQWAEQVERLAADTSPTARRIVRAASRALRPG